MFACSPAYRPASCTEDRIGVMVERDDAWTRPASERFSNEVVEQVDVAAMEPVEDADDREERTVPGAEGVDAGHDLHQAPTVRVAAESGAATRTLSGARRPPPAGTAMATSRAPSSMSL